MTAKYFNSYILGTCFWTQSELEEKAEYERVAFPRTVPEMMKINEEDKQYQRERIIQREESIETKLVKLSQWRKDIEARKEKKETVSRYLNINIGINLISISFVLLGRSSS